MKTAMTKLMLPIVTAIIMSAGTCAFAASKIDTHAAAAKMTKTAASSTTDDVIKLYAEPNTKAKVLASIDVSQQLIPIFHKDGWIKVGNPADGAVGWIDKKQFQQAMNNAFHQHIQTVYVQKIQQNGKAPQVTVYQDGKKLTGEQANAVYANIKKHQQQMQKNMHLFQEHMNAWMNQPMPAFPIMAMPQPVIIIENGNGNNHATATENAAKKKS